MGSTSSTITIDGASGKNVNDLHGMNVKKDDSSTIGKIPERTKYEE